VFLLSPVRATGQAAQTCANCGRDIERGEEVAAFGGDGIDTEFVGQECIEARTTHHEATGHSVVDMTQQALAEKASAKPQRAN
jgi:hypothetical protein